MSRLPSIRDDDAEDAAKKPFVPPHLLGESVRSPHYIGSQMQRLFRPIHIGNLQATVDLLIPNSPSLLTVL